MGATGVKIIMDDEIGVVQNDRSISELAGKKDLALLTDFYELTMMYGFWKKGRENRRVCFEYFFRELPPHNGFALFAGLDQVLSFIKNFSFTEEDLRYLGEVGLPGEFLEYLRSFRLEIDLWAVPEGTVVFPYEPLVRVEGPLASAQLLEAFLLNALNYDSGHQAAGSVMPQKGIQ